MRITDGAAYDLCRDLDPPANENPLYKEIVERGRDFYKLRDLVLELADELEAEIHARYNPLHPAMRRRFDRDMEPVQRAREACE